MLKQAEKVLSDYPSDNAGSRRQSPADDLVGLVACALIFALALSLRYWYVFITPHINVASVSDASEFLRNAQAMLNLSTLPLSFWQDAIQALSGSSTPAQLAHIKQTLSPLQGLYISGPVIPLFFGWCYVVSLTPFSFANCTPPLVGNVIISALTCVLFALTAQHTFDKKTGYLTGVLCAIYPAFIINSGRLYCETLAAFLLSAVCLLTVRGFAKEFTTKETLISALATGFLAACLQFTRSITVVLTVALLPILLLQQGLRKGMLALPMFLIGFAIVALPWLGLQQLAFGSAGLVVDRVGHYNFFMGNHVDGAGFVSFPYEDGTGVEKRSLPQLAKEAISRSPSRWLHLMLQDKPLRLFKMPWNDFRAALGPIDFHAQALFHQLMLLLGAIGVILAFAIGPENLSGSRVQIRRASTVTPSKVFLVSIFGLHCAYMCFITVPRYNLTVMPIVLIFAAAACVGLLALARERGGFSAMLGVLVSSVFLFAIAGIPLAAFVQLIGAKYLIAALVVQCTLKFFAVASLAYCLWQSVETFTLEAKRTASVAPSPLGRLVSRTAVVALFGAALLTLVIPARGQGRWDEWAAPLNNDRSAQQQLVIPQHVVNDLMVNRRTAYLLIDSDGADSAQSFKVFVNGKPVNAPVIAGNSLVDQGNFDLMMNIPTGGFMREGEWIFNCLTAPSGVSNADLRQWFFVPLAPELLAGKGDVKVALHSNRGEEASPVVFGNYGSKRGKSTIPSVNVYSWEKTFFGVENDRGLCDTRYDARLTDDRSVPQTRDLSGALGLQTGRYNLRLLVDPARTDDLAAFIGPLKPAPVSSTASVNPSGTTAAVTAGMQQLALLPVGDVRLSTALAPYKATMTTLPAFSPSDWWLVRVKGDVRSSTGKGAVALDVKAVGDNTFYQSPWTGTLAVGKQWRSFDNAVPIMPGKLKAMTPTSISCEFKAPAGSAPADTEFKNVQMEIVRIPGNPLTSGYEVF